MTTHVVTYTPAAVGRDCWVTCSCGFSGHHERLSDATRAAAEHHREHEIEHQESD